MVALRLHADRLLNELSVCWRLLGNLAQRLRVTTKFCLFSVLLFVIRSEFFFRSTRAQHMHSAVSCGVVSVCLSVCLSVTRRCCIETNERVNGWSRCRHTSFAGRTLRYTLQRFGYLQLNENTFLVRLILPVSGHGFLFFRHIAYYYTLSAGFD